MDKKFKLANSNYSTYRQWKNWNWVSYKDIAPWERRYFAGEMRRLGLVPSADVLEIGFGSGSFMEWARNAGYRVSGVELIEELVELAIGAEFEAVHHDVAASPCAPAAFPVASFDAIVAFDVIEHLSMEGFANFLAQAALLLKPGGYLLARFPNGGSPFGLLLQNGDSTHQTSFTESKLKQCLINTSFNMIYCGNPYRVTGDGKFRLLQVFGFHFRNVFEVFMGWIYFNRRIPLDPCLVALFKKSI